MDRRRTRSRRSDNPGYDDDDEENDEDDGEEAEEIDEDEDGPESSSSKRKNSYSAEEDDRGQDVCEVNRRSVQPQQQPHRNRKSLPTHFYRRIFAAGINHNIIDEVYLFVVSKSTPIPIFLNFIIIVRVLKTTIYRLIKASLICFY